MLVEGDIVEVVVNQRHIPTGQTLSNVFHYQATDVFGDWSDTGAYAQMAADVLISMHEVVSVYQTTDVTYDNATVENLSNSVDIGEYAPPSPLNGVVSGSIEPLQVALSFKLVRATRTVRNGSKRFGGIADSFLTDPQGSALSGTVATVAIQDFLATPLEIVIAEGTSCVLVPIILRKTPTGTPPTVFALVASAVYRGAGSQNSRKQLL